MGATHGFSAVKRHGDPTIEMDVKLDHGVTKRTVEATVAARRDARLDVGDGRYRDAPADSSGRADGARAV